jgi:hypothetical protein
MNHSNVSETARGGSDGVAMPIVALNRWILVLTIGAAMVTQQAWLTTVLVALLLPAVIFGQARSPIAWLGRQVLGRQIATAPREDRRLMRFNNTIALGLLSSAQAAFLLEQPVVGWTLAAIVALAAGIALAGFCVGCFIYYQFKLQRFRLFGS